jgi:type III secretion protein W
MYRGEVVGFTKPQDCFRSLLAARGAEGLKDAIDFLVAGCGADLKSSTPSLDPAALGRIMTDLQCVQVLQTVMDALTALGRRMDRQFGEKCLLDGGQMSGRVLDFTEQAFVAASGIAAFIGDCGMKALLARMDFARELTSLFRKLSPRLFAREGDRQRLVDAAQEHLDDLIAEEEDAS